MDRNYIWIDSDDTSRWQRWHVNWWEWQCACHMGQNDGGEIMVAIVRRKEQNPDELETKTRPVEKAELMQKGYFQFFQVETESATIALGIHNLL